METVTQVKFGSALNKHYSQCGSDFLTIEDAKQYLKAREFKKIQKNIYKNDKYKLAYLTGLREAKCNDLGEIIRFKSIGWLITFSGNEPISFKECVFRVKT